MKPLKNIEVVKAIYIGDYVLQLHFNDGTEKEIDFKKSFSKLKGYYAQYFNKEKFLSFTIDEGNLVWGENWDVIFPVNQLHKGVIK